MAKRCCDGLSRRKLLDLGLTASVGYLMSGVGRWAWAGDPSPAAAKSAAATAKHLIVLWLSGGPSHLDTFDPKPGTTQGGPFKAINTAIPGVQFSEHLPRLAAVADKVAILRSLSSREGSHARATYLMHTGYIPNPSVQYPALGSMLSHELGDDALALPSFVSLGGPSEGAGFFGPKHAPFVVRAKPGQPIENLRYFAKVDAGRFEERLKLVQFMDQGFAATGATAEAQAHEEVLRRATLMIQSPLVKAFELTDEPQAVKDLYGAGEFGQRCLMARRLVEAGVKAVEVELRGWDTHENNFERSKTLMADLDPGVSGLITDLATRGLLDQTLVVCMGEFGRSPRINPREGRDHHPRAFSGLLAGGGLRAGRVVGATDSLGENVVGPTIGAPDIFATVLKRLGVDPGKLYHSNDRPITLSNKGKVIADLV